MQSVMSVMAAEQSHDNEVRSLAKERCPPTNLSGNSQSGCKYGTNLNRDEGAARLSAKIALSETCSSDRTAVASRQTSEQPLTERSTDFGLTDGHAKVSRPCGSVMLPDSRNQPVTCKFGGTRHESYKNLGIAGLAGLSSTSATLALLPLQASGQLHTTTTQPLPPVTTLSALSSSPPLISMLAASGTTVLNVHEVGPGQDEEKLGADTGHTAASIRDRRSTFFSEPPKPISLPTRSAMQMSTLCDADRVRLDSKSELETNISSPGSQESNGPSLLVTSVPGTVSRSISNLSTVTIETMNRSSSPQLRSGYERRVLASEASLVCLDMPTSLSGQRDVLQFSDQSAASVSDSEDTQFSVFCGPPEDAAALDPASTVTGESGIPVTEQLCEAFAQSLPMGSSALITPAKVGNIQKLKAFFGETTPRIMEGKTDSKTSGEMPVQGAAITVEHLDRRPEAIGDMGIRQMQTSFGEQAAITSKGKKMATWVLASRHHNSQPQLPSTRPKKSLPDREPSLSPKQKEHRRWKGKVVRKFKRHGSSSAVVSDPPSQPDEITGTFGIPLECCFPSVSNECVPLVVEVCTQVVEERGLANQGIYRVPGNSLAINNLVEELNRDPESASADNEKWQDVNSVSSVLKLFFRKLPDSLITDELYECVITANRMENSERRMLKLKKLLHDLPEHNFETFRFLAQHLNKVSMLEEQNKMDVHNLAIMFGPTLVRPQDNSIFAMARDNADQCRIVESIISHCEWFFSSWDEDVNVPVDEVPTEPVPISGMSEQMLAKAESLASDSSTHRDLLSSLIHAANKKLRLRDKSKSVDNDMFEPSIASRSKSTTQVHQVTNTATAIAEVPPTRPSVNTAESAVCIRRYPAYQFDSNRNAVSMTTENFKPVAIRRIARSYESLNSVKVCVPTASSRSGHTLPLEYRSGNK